jgi:NAD(P)-dependent dehydrogenase (short-subunit alcohol dehydrogenase family)
MANHHNGALSNTKVLIVGAGAMGVATTRQALDAGAQVTLAGRAADRLTRIAAISDRLRTAVADTSDPDQTDELMGSGAPWDHVAVLTGGVATTASSIIDTPLPNAQLAFARLWMTYNVLRLAPETVKPGGSVEVLSGSSGRRPLAGFGVWGSLHGSIEALARSAAVELSPIRVNVVSPGGIGIRMDRQLVPHRGVPDDVASMVVALMTNPAATSTFVDIDGGERLGTYPSPRNAYAHHDPHDARN